MRRTLAATTIWVSVLVLGIVGADAQDHDPSAPLTGAAEVGFAPFLMSQPDGSLAGFNYDLNTALAERMGRPSFELVEVPWASIFAGLYAGRYEYIAAPVTITEKRAGEMLFGEPYIDTGLAFITLENKRLSSVEELRGKRISAVSGSVQDDWMTQNAEEYGITPVRFDGTSDALQALQIGRIDAHMSTDTAGRWMAQERGGFAVDVTLPAYGSFALAFRPDDVAFRNEVETALECIKTDGTLSGIYEKWFGVPPSNDSSVVTVYEGMGAPGWPGHDADAEQPDC